MINSQIPYNQLNPIQDIHISIDRDLVSASMACRDALFHLNGYLEAIESNTFMQLIHVIDSKYSFDLEEIPISLNRLFESMVSENHLNDQSSAQIFAYLEWFAKYDKGGLAALEPVFVNTFRKMDMYREKKEIRIKSYFTNLSLYTAPTQSSTLRMLRKDLDQFLKKPNEIDELIYLCLCHYQIRVLSPFNIMNGHMARTFTKLYLREMKLYFDVLPISIFIYKQRETYNTLIRDGLLKSDLKPWCMFLLKTIKESAELTLNKLKQFHGLKKRNLDQLEKYTDYHLPAEVLNNILMSSPYIKPSILIKGLNCHRQTAYTYLNQLVKMGILIEKSSGREKLYFNKDFLDILSS